MNEEIPPRRQFFKSLVRKSGEGAKKMVSQKLEAAFKRQVIRPPGAVSEERFLLACTRKGDCVEACPHDAIHLMAEGTGLFKNTPFIDVKHKACQACEDWPCIDACAPGVLHHNPETQFYRIGVARVDLSHCLVEQGQYCDYCFNSCPSGIKAITKDKNNRPAINEDDCIGCGKCAFICVSQTGDAIRVDPI